MTADLEIDARGLCCPLPLLKAKQGLNQLEAGQLLGLVATDSGSWRDFHAFTRQSGDDLVEAEERGGEYHYLIRKASMPG